MKTLYEVQVAQNSGRQADLVFRWRQDSKKTRQQKVEVYSQIDSKKLCRPDKGSG
jgi:hypothetical protein